MAWRDIVANRYAAGRLITPEIYLDCMERDYALFTVPFDFEMAVLNGTDGTTDFNLEIVFPDTWAEDVSLSASMRLQISLWFEVRAKLLTGSNPAWTLNFFLPVSTKQAAINAGDPFVYGYQEVVGEFASPFPTGITTVPLRVVSNGGGFSDWDVRRPVGRGPDSYFRWII